MAISKKRLAAILKDTINSRIYDPFSEQICCRFMCNAINLNYSLSCKDLIDIREAIKVKIEGQETLYGYLYGNTGRGSDKWLVTERMGLIKFYEDWIRELEGISK